MDITCLIPFYNERERIAPVLEVLTTINQIAQVLCIDDGSMDGTSDFIQQHWPDVEVVRLPQNAGKAAAVKYGLKHVRSKHVLLMDADLQDINKAELEAAIEAYILHADAVNMLILRRINAPWFVKWYRSDILLSGERLLRKQDLERALYEPIKCYQLEVAINRYMLRHRKVVRWIPWSAINTYKVDKLGVIDGSLQEFRMYVDIVSYVGFSHMMLQLASFTRKLRHERQQTTSYTYSDLQV
ncbi:glycosyltransferase family 2 protein [Pontibacter sp. 172403-2]|uniref:glycosyltransferase family 2 protein n=1 Tax=Pontibacter rufus TaxID=2791028 RepID=UPI0018B00C20|nr:glycosyltransferase family 2 protein [Pontibacter sp. 172403-2]MBF9255223.1 glycosyltransferase family 2 protein [Pontibacter sp. 172403-2]